MPTNCSSDGGPRGPGTSNGTSEDPRVLALKQEFNLEHLRTSAVEVRPGQWELLRELLTTTEHTAISARTGSGKTVLFLIKATQVLAQNKRVMIASVKRPLVRQIARHAMEFMTLPASAFALLNGEQSTKRRSQVYQSRPRVIVATREVICNDIKSGHFVWDDLGLIVLDEVHHAQGDDAYNELIPLLQQRPIQRVICSATLARDSARLSLLLNDAGCKLYLVLDDEQEGLVEHSLMVDLDTELLDAASILKEEVRRCLRRIKSEARIGQQLLLFEEDVMKFNDDPTSPLPSHSEREKLLTNCGHLKDAESGKYFWLLSQWSELGLLCWLHDSLVTLGRFSFLEDFSYRYAKYRLTPRAVHLPELDSRSPGERRFEARVIGNKRLWATFARLAAETPYQAFVKHSRWQDVCASLGNTVEFVESNPGSAAQAAFDYALNLSAQGSSWDHPKLARLLEVIHRHPRQLDQGKLICFTWTRRHARFLTAWLNQRLSRVGYHATCATGSRSASARRNSLHSLEEFREGAANLLVTTDFVREGLDVPKAHVCIEFCVPDSDPIKRIQGSGRVGRGGNGSPAYLYHLLTRQSEEAIRLVVSRDRIRNMQRAARNRGRLILPDQPELEL